MGSWGAAIVGFFKVVALLLSLGAKRTEQKEENQDATNIQNFRQDLDGDNVDAACAEQHDRVQRALCGDPGGRNNNGEKIDAGQSLQR